jgi:dipeptidyl-peptidase-3
MSSVQFATEEQSKILTEWTMRCYEIHVACHELLGHGVGKTLYRNADGSAHKFTDPVTGEEYESCYEEGDTWNGRFGAFSTSYEECRADTCGFYLAPLPDVYSLFGFKEDEIPTMLWVNVMNQFRKGVLGLQLFNAEKKKWGQAHTQGAYVFTQYLYQNQKSDIVKFELTDQGDGFLIHLNKENLMGEGRELIRKFLNILQVYKSSGAVERAKVFYDKYSEVNDFFLQVRDLVV